MFNPIEIPRYMYAFWENAPYSSKMIHTTMVAASMVASRVFTSRDDSPIAHSMFKNMHHFEIAFACALLAHLVSSTMIGYWHSDKKR